jgi:hypothetical protein
MNKLSSHRGTLLPDGCQRFAATCARLTRPFAIQRRLKRGKILTESVFVALTESLCNRVGSTRSPKWKWGARASRVRVRASRPNFRHPQFSDLPAQKYLLDEVFGSTPKTTRQRRVLPAASHHVRLQLQNSGSTRLFQIRGMIIKHQTQLSLAGSGSEAGDKTTRAPR